MRLRYAIPLLLLGSLHGQSLPHCYPSVGSITNICVNIGADPGHPVVTWTQPSGSCLYQQTMSASPPPSQGSDDPSFNYFLYAAGPTTSCSFTIPLSANWNYSFSVDGCTASPCYRTSAGNAGAPYGTQTTAYYFTSQTGNPAHTFSANLTLNGPPQTNSIYQGHRANLSMNGLWVDGPAPNGGFAITHLDIDGNNCTVAANGGVCPGAGTTHIRTQFIPSSEEIVSPATNNYGTGVQSGGAFNGDYLTTSPNLGYAQMFLQVFPDADASNLGSHMLHVTGQWLNYSGGVYTATGAPSSATFTFAVIAPPSFTFATPSGSTPPAMGAWNQHIGTYLTDILGFQTANQTAPGQYLAYNSPDQYTFDPTGFAAYDPARAELGISDYLTEVATAWTASHSYTTSNITSSNGYYWWPHAACTSGATAPAGATVNATFNDGGCTWTNYGSTAFWYAQTQRIEQQNRNFMLLMSKYRAFWQEWSYFTDGLIMTCYRAYSSLANCQSSLEASALTHSLYPIVPSSFGDPNQKQKIIYTGIQTPVHQTWRALAYSIEGLANQWYETGVKPVDGGVDELAIRSDLLIDGFNQLFTCDPTQALSATYPCADPQVAVYPTNFDFGFSGEALAKYCDAEKHFLGACDPVIAKTIVTLADWLYSHEYNLQGDHGQPYPGFAVPYLTTNYNYAQPSLNNITAGVFAWGGAANGNASLPTSGTPIWTAGDAYWQHTFDNVVDGGISGKEGSEWFKWFYDYYQWRTGTWTYDQEQSQPALNAYVSTWPDLLEPYPLNEVPAQPAAACGPASCTFTVYTSKQRVTNYVRYCTTAGCNPATGIQVPGTGSTLTDAQASLYTDTITVTGLPPSTTGNWGIGGIDAQGNPGFSDFNISLGACCFTFTTTAGTGITVTCTLPLGTVGAAYSGSCSAAGGTAPYTWAISAGALPADLSLNATTGAVTGIPTTQQVASFTVQATDALTHTGTLSTVLQVTSLAITTTSLPAGTQGVAYSATLTAAGGTLPYTWSLLAGALPGGVTLNATTGALTGTPTSCGTFTPTFRVTDSEAPPVSRTATFPFAVGGCTLAIVTTTLPDGAVGVPYSQPVQASGGTVPYTFCVVESPTVCDNGAGTLPVPLTLTTTGSFVSVGLVAGTPAAAGTVTFTVRVTDHAGAIVTGPVALTITSTAQQCLTLTGNATITGNATLTCH